MKVLFVLNLFPHYRLAIIERLIKDNEIDYTISAGVNGVLPSLKNYSGADLTKYVAQGKFIPIKNIWFGKHFLWQKGFGFSRIYTSYDVVIHTGSMYQITTWIALIKCRCLRKRTLLWTHGLSEKESGFKWLIRKQFYRLANGLLLYGNRAKSVLNGSGFNADNLYVVYNSLDYEKQKSERENVTDKQVRSVREASFEIPELTTLIYIGRLTAEKDPLLLLDLVEKMEIEGVPVNIMIIGDGPEMNRMFECVKSRNLSKFIKLYGAIYDEAILAELMCASDIAIMPGYIGLSAMHYLAYGLPILTSDDMDKQKPEAEAIVAGVTGDFYEHANIDSLAALVCEWKNKLDVKTKRVCISQIEKFYNPKVQHEIISYACQGLPASQQPHLEDRVRIRG